MKFQAFHVNPGEKLKKKDVNNDLSNFMSVFPNTYLLIPYITSTCFRTSYTCTIVVQLNSIIAPWQYNTRHVEFLNLKYDNRTYYLTQGWRKKIQTKYRSCITA